MLRETLAHQQNVLAEYHRQKDFVLHKSLEGDGDYLRRGKLRVFLVERVEERCGDLTSTEVCESLEEANMIPERE